MSELSNDSKAFYVLWIPGSLSSLTITSLKLLHISYAYTFVSETLTPKVEYNIIYDITLILNTSGQWIYLNIILVYIIK